MTTVAIRTTVPTWATEISVTDSGTTDEFVSYTAELFRGMPLPHPVFVNTTVELRLIAWQHNLHDGVHPAGQPYLEVMTTGAGYDSSLLVLTGAAARTLAAALVAAATTIEVIA